MKKLIIGLTAFVGITLNSYAAVPVVDAGNIAQAIQQVEQLKQQYDALKTQISQLTDLNSKLEGTTDFSGIQDVIGGLSPELQDSLGLLNGSIEDAGALQSKIKEIMDGNFEAATEIFDDVTSLNAGIYQARAQRAVAGQVISEETESNVNKIVDNISTLQGKIKTAKDAKEIADIQAQISTQMAILQAVSVRGDAANMNTKAQEGQEMLQIQAEREKAQKEARSTLFGN